METIGHFLIIALTFYLLTKVVDEYFLASLDNIAKYLKMPATVAGATLLAIGTSAPELGTAMFALMLPEPNPAIGAGTIVGSAIFQLLVVVGFTAIISKSTQLNWRVIIRDSGFYLLAALLLFLVISDFQVTFDEALLMVSFYFVYLAILIFGGRLVGEKRVEEAIDELEEDIQEIRKEEKRKGVMRRILDGILIPVSWTTGLIPDVEKKPKYTVPVFLGSLVVIGILSYVTVNSAQVIATNLNISAAIIALTILAGGTSVPELVSSAIVSKKGKSDMAIANAIGSNTFDILISLGLPLLIFTYTTGNAAMIDDPAIINSVGLLIAVTLGVVAMFAFNKFKIGRKFGYILLVVYAIYILLAVTGVI